MHQFRPNLQLLISRYISLKPTLLRRTMISIIRISEGDANGCVSTPAKAAEG